MENILEKICAKARERVAEQSAKVPLSEVRAQAEQVLAGECGRCGAEAEGAGELGRSLAPCGFPFESMIARDGLQFICECKKASPSKGVIAEAYDPVAAALDYEAAGAAAVSCLTEPFWFEGSLEHLREVAAAVSIPVLRKDFVVSDYMVYEAKASGTAAVLLICAVLDQDQLRDYIQLCDSLHMSALVEAHDAHEVERAAAAGARVVGVNNRDLRTFEVDLDTSVKLRGLAPEGTLFVAESGIRSAGDVARLAANGTDAVLVGETLMRARDKRAALAELKAGAR